MIEWFSPLEFLSEDWVSWHVEVIDICVGKLVVSIIVVPLHQQLRIIVTQIYPKRLVALLQILNGEALGSILGWMEELEACDGIEILTLNYDLLFHAFQILF